MDLEIGSYYGDDTVMAAVPELSPQVLTLDYGEGLEERLKILLCSYRLLSRVE
jgi:hypothetical protein